MDNSINKPFDIKKRLIGILFVSTFLFVSAAASLCADFQKGVDATQSGDYATALREFRTLAEQGHAIAQNNLAAMYDQGIGVTQDYKEAAKWYRLAAEQGEVIAQGYLGVMYEKGRGVLQDYKEAAKWYRLAAEQGSTIAQVDLGVMYEKGQGAIRDIAYAYMWYNISASLGDGRGRTYRDAASKKMTSSQLEKAQDLSRECVRNKYKGC